MSIKIGVNSLSSKDVIDVKAGVSSSVFKNIDIVKDWNEKIIWQRDKRNELLSSNTSFSYQKTWSDTSSNKYYQFITRKLTCFSR